VYNKDIKQIKGLIMEVLIKSGDKHCFPISTIDKNISTITTIISMVAAPVLLAAGIHSLGAATVTLAGVSLAVPPVGIIVAGALLLVLAACLFNRLIGATTSQENFISRKERSGKAPLRAAEETGNACSGESQRMAALRAAEEAVNARFKESQHMRDSLRKVQTNGKRLPEGALEDFYREHYTTRKALEAAVTTWGSLSGKEIQDYLPQRELDTGGRVLKAAKSRT
jgi:hypothetical protein